MLMNRDYQWPQKRGDPTVQFRSQQHTKKKINHAREKKNSRIMKTISLNSELQYMDGISLYFSEFKFASQIQLDQREGREKTCGNRKEK